MPKIPGKKVNKYMEQVFDSEMLKRIYEDGAVRKAIARQSHFMHFNIYHAGYIKYPTAQFQREIFAITEDPTIKTAVITAFRGAAKSSIITTSYPIWAILGLPAKRFVVIISQTQRQAKQHLLNIKAELESNELLKTDLGPFTEDRGEWGSYSLIIPGYNAKIMAVSIEESFRGIRYLETRPDLIICDDVEDLDSVKTKEGRDKTYRTLMADILPLGDLDTKVIITGNLLHHDSLIMRLKKDIEEGRFNATFKMYPLIDDSGKIYWPGKFPDQNALMEFKKNVPSEIDWMREYLLKIMPEDGQEILPEWIHYYDEIPHDKKAYRHTLTGVDPAATEKTYADFTGIVSARIFGYGPDLKIVILPNPINRKMGFPEAVAELKRLYDFKDGGKSRRILVEGYGYQKVLAQMLVSIGIPAQETIPLGMDKRARLRMTSQFISTGRIVFPRHGAEELINQLVYFGAEKHDDLVDAFTLVVYQALEEMKRPNMPSIYVIDLGHSRRRGLSDFDDDDD